MTFIAARKPKLRTCGSDDRTLIVSPYALNAYTKIMVTAVIKFHDLFKWFQDLGLRN